ncbi:NAD-dependent deacylase [candidate division KSB1 bacterium]|nr:NAD-dependent deacylase [candidate division KSB1 bacterium]RQW01244.1 MAG: NAD-dependent deacylase [candidate division KSB1 bacterium]
MIEISDNVLDRLVDAKKVAVLTGAGISAESGIATFRGKDGIWTKLKPDELASMEAFLRNPARVLEWYEHRRTIIEQVQPNPAHIILAEMEKFYPDFSLSTQNIDGLHKKAGSTIVYELHGSILRNRCNECGRLIENIKLDELPRCDCGGLVRPDVVWFGEMLPIDILDMSYAAAQEADVYFSIGTSAAVYPAAYLPIEAKNNGAFVIEINLDTTTISNYVDVSYRGKAGEILPELWNAVKNKINAIN